MWRVEDDKIIAVPAALESYLLPEKVSERFRRAFMERVPLRRGAELSIEGFIIDFSRSGFIFDRIYPRMFPEIGPFVIKGLTPFPERGYPVVPLVIPRDIYVNTSVAEISGKSHDFSEYSGEIEGRFILVENMQKRSLENYLATQKPTLDGIKAERIIRDSFPENTGTVMLPVLISSPNYVNRVGGCGLSLGKVSSKYYDFSIRDVKSVYSSLNPLIRGKKVRVPLIYADLMEIETRVPMKIRYTFFQKSQSAVKFFKIRKSATLWEKSAFVPVDLKKGDMVSLNILGLADVPFLPRKDEIYVVSDEVSEYSYDIAHLAFYNHLMNPTINPLDVERIKELLLMKIRNEFKTIYEAMINGLLIGMSEIGGFGEHISRVSTALKRAGYEDPLNRVWEIYELFFDRVEDAYYTKIKTTVASRHLRRRLARIVNEVLQSLNILYPDGWKYEWYLKRMEWYDIDENKAYKIFMELYEKRGRYGVRGSSGINTDIKIIKEVAPGIYKATGFLKEKESR